MMLFLSRDGAGLGSFAPEEVRAGLLSGRFLRTDLFFTEGMADWRPLQEWQGAAGDIGQARGASRFKLPLLLGCAGLLSVGGLLLLVLAVWWLRPAAPEAKGRAAFAPTLALFRTGMLHDPLATVHRFTDEGIERQFAESSIELWAPIAPDVGWSYWFNTAVFTGLGLDGAEPRTAFYHPWSDTVWLAEWTLANKPRLTRIWFGSGDVLRAPGKPPWQATPLWLRGKGPRADALAMALARTVPLAERALASGDWPDDETRKDSARRANLSLCRMPLLELVSGLVPLRHSVDGEEAAIARLRTALATLRRGTPAAVAARLRDAPENTPDARKVLQSMPATFAGTLQPVCRVGAGSTAYVVLMPSQSADVALATVWDATASGARLVRVDVLPFAELLKAARAAGGRS